MWILISGWSSCLTIDAKSYCTDAVERGKQGGGSVDNCSRNLRTEKVKRFVMQSRCYSFLHI